jgi:hypothetical protein
MMRKFPYIRSRASLSSSSGFALTSSRIFFTKSERPNLWLWSGIRGPREYVEVAWVAKSQKLQPPICKGREGRARKDKKREFLCFWRANAAAAKRFVVLRTDLVESKYFGCSRSLLSKITPLIRPETAPVSVKVVFSQMYFEVGVVLIDYVRSNITGT